MAPWNLEAVHFGISDYAQFRFLLIYYCPDTAPALTSLKYHIRCLMDYSELCCWHRCSSEDDCEGSFWWRSLTPELSNTLGFISCQKLPRLFDGQNPSMFDSLAPKHLTHSLFINWICSHFIFDSHVRVSIWRVKHHRSTSAPSFPHIYGSRMMYPMPLAVLCCWLWRFPHIIERLCDRSLFNELIPHDKNK